MKAIHRGIELELICLQDQGFIFRIPGGKSRDNKHSSYAIAPQFYNKRLYLLVVPYNERIPKRTKKPEPLVREDSRQALEFKVNTQTGVVLIAYQEIAVQEAKNNNQGVHQEKHMKRVYLVTEFDESNLRTSVPPGDRKGIPLWVEFEALKTYLCEPHQWMLKIDAVRDLKEL